MRSSVLSQKKIREKRPEKNRAKETCGKQIYLLFSSVSAQQEDSHVTCRFSFTHNLSLFLTVTGLAFKRRIRLSRVSTALERSQGKYSSPYHSPLATQPRSCFTDMHYESGVTCPTPCSPFNHPPLHRHTRPNNFISVISQSPHRAAFLPGICKGNLTQGKPSRGPAFQQELQQNWKLII